MALQIRELKKALQKIEEAPKVLPEPEATPVADTQSEQPQENQPQFKAVGVISGFVSLIDQTSKLQIQVGAKTYPLGYPQNNQQPFRALKRTVAAGGKELSLIVYPRFIHFPGRDKEPQISFQVIGFFTGVKAEWPAFEFKLAGFWQFIPVCRKPCISVFKNFTQERLASLKAEKPDEKFLKFLKASHLPMSWRDSTVKPFFYNVRLTKEEQGKAPFLEVTARFSPSLDCFEFLALGNASLDAPRFIKPPKATGIKASGISKKRQVYAAPVKGKPSPAPVKPKPIKKTVTEGDRTP